MSLVLDFFFCQLSFNEFFAKKATLIGFAMIEKIQLERKSVIAEECKEIKLKARKKPDLARFYIEHRHGLMYCDVPKVNAKLSF